MMPSTAGVPSRLELPAGAGVAVVEGVVAPAGVPVPPATEPVLVESPLPLLPVLLFWSSSSSLPFMESSSPM